MRLMIQKDLMVVLVYERRLVMNSKMKWAIAALGACAYYAYKHREVEASGQGQTALITGASSGIGQAFAQVYAAHGFDLVLTARHGDKLEEIATTLEEDYGVKVTIITADLSHEDEAHRLYQEVKNRGIVIDQLVNNAGAGHAGDIVDTDPQIMQDLIHLNISAMTILSHDFGSDMVKRGEGKILNVSSLGAFIPDPHFNVYGLRKHMSVSLVKH